MRRLELTKTASADLQSIRRYSHREWGPERTATYMAALAELMKNLVRGSAVSRDRGDLKTGLRMAASGRHCVFFEEDASRILVVRVLHDRMDHRQHLEGEQAAE